MATREKGVQTTPCPNCETDLKFVELPDGAVAAEACPKCFTGPVSEKASKSQSASREKGTTNTATEEK